MIHYQSQNVACIMPCLHVISVARMPLSEGAFFYEFSLQNMRVIGKAACI
jgi:hypothetical protein